jgi:hypothetical protein
LLAAHPACARLHRCVIRHESRLPSAISTHHIPSIVFLRKVEVNPNTIPLNLPSQAKGEANSNTIPLSPPSYGRGKYTPPAVHPLRDEGGRAAGAGG